MKSFLDPLLRAPAEGLQLANERTGSMVATTLLMAVDSQSRRTGLLKHTSLADGHAMIIAPTGGIHTFFMKFDIDIAFVARDGRVVKTRAALRPWRVSLAPFAYAVVEMPSGTLARTGTRQGDRLGVVAR
jgi:hypothetical protein